MFVVWKWTWIEEAVDSDNMSSDSGHSTKKSKTSGDETTDVTPHPDIIHSVVFKCIGSLKEPRYQEILKAVSQKIRNGETVLVTVEEEPDNSFDSRAIAFMCNLDDKWERIGYIVREAVEAVHDAIRHKQILEVSFEWVKYIAFFRDCGWYAGIIISKKCEWPQCVLRSCAKTFN